MTRLNDSRNGFFRNASSEGSPVRVDETVDPIRLTVFGFFSRKKHRYMRQGKVGRPGYARLRQYLGERSEAVALKPPTVTPKLPLPARPGDATMTWMTAIATGGPHG